MIAASTAVGIVSTKNGYWAANPRAMDQLNGLYIQPYYRISTCLTGVLLRYILYKKYSIATLPIKNWLKQSVYIIL